ncbi:MAG: hypothetical protein K2Q18_04775 [Bdellovibrionales bacterium]|nr:hypothetical protein [Bdellovibrionales bacterium]
MAKVLHQSGLKLTGIAPNILLTHVLNTAPFLFNGEIDTQGFERAYLAKLVFYKKNLNALKNIDLTEYFHICLCAHWATAGTFVPTDVDNQIRKGLWEHPDIKKNIERMGKLTIAAWSWDYEQMTNRKSYNPERGQVMSTHEGTWLSVAIGGYIALMKHKHFDLAKELGDVILAEADKEEKLLLELREKRDHVNFLRSTALMAHNFGDLDRVIDQWEMPEDDPFRQRIYKLGHKLNGAQDPILVYAGQVNKAFLSVENHRHMSMRQAKCLRRSNKFLIPVGPFMDKWGRDLGESKNLSLDEKGEIVCAFLEGFKRQDKALGYVRAYHGMMSVLPRGLETLEQNIPFDVVRELGESEFGKLSKMSESDMVEMYKKKLEDFVCPITNMKF